MFDSVFSFFGFRIKLCFEFTSSILIILILILITFNYLGARIVILCRDTEKGKKVSEEIICQLPACDVVIYHCDLSSLSSVRQCAQELLKNEPRIDILINNAGIACVPQSKSEDGYEKQFATNHLGHFLLTLLLLDRIKQSTPSRIINVSSIVHYCKWKYFNHN